MILVCLLNIQTSDELAGGNDQILGFREGLGTAEEPVCEAERVRTRDSVVGW